MVCERQIKEQKESLLINKLFVNRYSLSKRLTIKRITNNENGISQF
jgi:hypothetical protein